MVSSMTPRQSATTRSRAAGMARMISWFNQYSRTTQEDRLTIGGELLLTALYLVLTPTFASGT
jgi:hypothetical protein